MSNQVGKPESVGQPSAVPIGGLGAESVLVGAQ